MSNKLKIILLSLFALVVSGCILLSFFVLKNKQTSNTPLTIYSQDLTLTVGESSAFYTLSNEKAEVEISSTNDNIFEVDNDKIIAISAGEATITLTATLNGEIARTSFVLTVENLTYSYSIECNTNCQKEGDYIAFTGNACQFSLTVYNKNNTIYTPQTVEISSSNGSYVTKEFNSYVLVSSQDCSVVFNIVEIDFLITVEFKIVA